MRVALLADVPDGQRRDGPSQRVVRRKHAVIPVPVFSLWRHEIGEPVEQRKGTGPLLTRIMLLKARVISIPEIASVPSA